MIQPVLKLTIICLITSVLIACGGGEAAQRNAKNSGDSTAVNDC